MTSKISAFFCISKIKFTNQPKREIPVLFFREGKAADEIVDLIKEEPNICILVLGAAIGKKGPGPLVTSLVGKLSGKFPIPITVVPGNLTLEEVDVLTQNQT